jgi:hypothetical protein
VRRALRAAREQEPSGDRRRKLDSLKIAARHSFPTADIDVMLDEITSGYLGSRK